MKEKLVCSVCGKEYSDTANGRRYYNNHISQCKEEKEELVEENIESIDFDEITLIEENDTLVEPWLETAFVRFSVNGSIRGNEKSKLKDLYIKHIADKLPGSESCKYTWITVLLALKKKLK
jgi:hypothetical protein